MGSKLHYTFYISAIGLCPPTISGIGAAVRVGIFFYRRGSRF